MLDAMRAFDWGSTPAGPIASWAEPLKHAARLMMLGATPMALLLGREGLIAYNDAMRELFGGHYDGSLARPVEDVLPEAASFYREAIDQCFAGQGCRFLDQPLRLCRNGEWKTAWFNLSFMPVADVEGVVSGALVIVSETTARVAALRELDNTRKRLEVALDASGMVGTWDIDVATNRLTGDERFARLFDISAEECFAGVDNDLLVDLVHP
ncbi:MAG: PAS domain-containing protein, partial [Novosphingobium sp.]